MTLNLSTANEFIARHIGPRQADEQAMLATLGFDSLETLEHPRDQRQRILTDRTHPKRWTSSLFWALSLSASRESKPRVASIACSSAWPALYPRPHPTQHPAY